MILIMKINLSSKCTDINIIQSFNLQGSSIIFLISSLYFLVSPVNFEHFLSQYSCPILGRRFKI